MLVFHDTDLGSDIDDAYALTALLRSDRVQLAGVGSVYSDAVGRARCAQAFVEACAADVPVYVGCDDPTAGDWPERVDALHAPACSPLPEIQTDQTAAEAICALAEAHPGRLTILATGPLTNIAAALEQRPALAGEAELVIMGGCLDGVTSEWNFTCDPTAAAAVLGSEIPIRLIPLDVTVHLPLGEEGVRQIAENPSAVCRLLSGCWKIQMGYNETDTPLLHDAAAAAAILWPELCTFEDKTLALDPATGLVTQGAGRTVSVLTELETDAFRTGLLELLDP